MEREHRVPLCGRTIEILDAARTLYGGERAVFTARSGQPLHGKSLRRLLQEHGIAAEPHGFRHRSRTRRPRRPTTRGRSSKRSRSPYSTPQL